jgi:hypothetical protein
MSYKLNTETSIRSQIKKMYPLLRPSPIVRQSAILCLLLAACTRDISGAHQLPTAMADTSLLTGDIGRALTPNGLFVLAGPPPGSDEELTEAQARTIGRTWAHQFFPSVKGVLEGQRGQKINADKLRDCPRLFYAESPYLPLEDTSDAGVARRVFGPWWIVPLCVDAVPQVELGVAAYATDVRIQDGRIVLPKMAGGEFVWRAIPASAAEFPLSPETAARVAAKQTGSRVASVPRMMMPHFRDGGPALARWEMTLAPPVMLESAQRHDTSAAASLFVGPEGPGKFDPVLFWATKDQPDQVQIRIPSATDARVYHTSILRRKSGGILRLQPAEVSKP